MKEVLWLLTWILGQDFLLEYVHFIDYKTRTLRTEKTDVQCWIANDKDSTEVKVKRTVSIPAFHGVWVPVSLTDFDNPALADTGFFEQLHTFNEDIEIVDGLIDARSDQILVSILNHSEHPVKLQAKTTVGLCRSAHHVNQRKIQHSVASYDDTREDPTYEKTLPDHLLDLFQRSSKHLNDEQKQKLFDLLIVYKDVFSISSDDLGCTRIIKHKIETGNEKPVRQPLRRQPITKRTVEREEVKKMLEKGVIEPSTSAWASNLVLVTKPNGTTRACVDYRTLNTKTTRYAYALPRITNV
ncbi:uncharacterized protein LOC125680030 [Ostrea edulis]|uniref:uncharacterized protein LOC125680030 n=1 Tax=Ostrea edulis TaxID=37623 RepID=UPI0024AEFC15|nr:uncharacterized protein LOC125680030 [Ostrea edulis]